MFEVPLFELDPNNSPPVIVVGINLSKHSSGCVLVDGELYYFVEEEKVSHRKNDSRSILSLYICAKHAFELYRMYRGKEVITHIVITKDSPPNKEDYDYVQTLWNRYQLGKCKFTSHFVSHREAKKEMLYHETEFLAEDFGTCLGASKLIWREISGDNTKRPITTRYLNEIATYERDLKENEIELHNVKPKDVAELLCDGNIVAIYQGRLEAGRRTFGNRSILYDPRNTDIDCEATVLEEYYHEYCNTDLLPINKKQNENYYNLIKEFYEITGIPMLINKPLEKERQTIALDMKDATWICRNSDISYLYCPERKMLIDFRKSII